MNMRNVSKSIPIIIILCISLSSINCNNIYSQNCFDDNILCGIHFDGYKIWFSRKYVLNITRNVILTTNNETSDIFTLAEIQSSLQKYFSDQMIPVTLFDTSTFLSLSKVKRNNESNSTVERVQKVLFFIIFDTIYTLNESISHKSWLRFYKKYNTEYYVFVIARIDINIVCSPDEDFTPLKDYYGGFFESMWKFAEVLEILLLFPDVCNKEIILKYDFVKTHMHSLYSEGVTVILEEDVKYDFTAFTHNFQDFNKYPLKINMFPRVPSLVETDMPKSFSNTYLDDDIAAVGHLAGFDGFTMSNLVKMLNFQPVISLPTDGQKYGRLENYTFTGSLGDIVYKRMDISFNARFIKNYKTDAIDFTIPIRSDYFCVITPSAQQIPHWMSIFFIFHLYVWVLIALCVLTSGIVWWFMKTKLLENSDRKEPFYIHYMNICLMFISNPILLPTIFQERLFITMVLIFNLIVAGLFQGQLSTAYSTVSYYSNIKTLQELDRSEYNIETSNDDIFGSNVTTVGDRLSKKIVHGDRGLEGVAKDRNYAAVERKADAKLLIERNFTTEYGEHLIHIVEDCPRSYHLSYIVYKGFPLLKYINTFLVRCVEAGLINVWYHFTDFSMLLPLRLQRKPNSLSERKLTLLDVQTSFVLLFIGISVSLVVFVTELILQKRIKDKSTKRLVRNETYNNPIIFYMSYCERLDSSRF